jgi:hypothetical protein
MWMCVTIRQKINLADLWFFGICSQWKSWNGEKPVRVRLGSINS